MLETIKSFSILLHYEIATCFDVKVVGVISGSHVGLADILHSLDDVSLLEVTPGNVLVDPVVFLIVS